MKKKKKKVRKTEHKRGYDMLNNTDTLWSRMNAQRKTTKDKGKQPLNGQGIQQKLDIEDPGMSPKDNSPLKMMDIVLQNWEATGDEEEPEEKE